jgi:hypothetical protein
MATCKAGKVIQDDGVDELFADGAVVVMYRNALGSFTAVRLAGETAVQAVAAMVEPLELVGKHVTDDRTPTLALESLTAKHGS